MSVELEHYLVVGALLFGIGLYLALAKRNFVGVLMGVELMFNAANLTFVAFSALMSTTAKVAAAVGKRMQAAVAAPA